jgi:hypothetical protein
MSMETVQRPEWEIDKRLKTLIGENVRVQASSFWPGAERNGAPPIKAKALRLPDNTTLDGPLFLEGKLLSFRREIGVVFVTLDRPALEGDTANGRVLFRGQAAVIIQGPATVLLDASHFVEKIPNDPKLYWNHLTASGSQFDLPLDR